MERSMDVIDAAADPILDHRLWQILLGNDAGPFACLAPGACIAVIPRLVAQRNAGTMLMCEAQAGGMALRLLRFSGFEKCNADIVFVINDEARPQLFEEMDNAGLATLRRLVRRGGVVLYFLKCEGALVEAGFEEFLESLGLNILGACR